MRNDFKRKRSMILCISAMLLVIFDSKCAIEGAKDGVELCLYIVIPTLFPFCVLSILLRSTISVGKFAIIRPFEKFCGLPEGCGIIMLLGLLGGYPIGAICIQQAVKDKCISSYEARYLRAICNNAGPSFIIGTFATTMQNMKLGIILIVIQLLSAVLSCIILSDRTCRSIQMPASKGVSLPEAIKQSCISMMNICGTIVFFRTFINIAKFRLSCYIPKNIWIGLAGLLELTNGVMLLSDFAGEAQILIVAAGMICFGGLCVAMQSIATSPPEASKYYLIGISIKSILAIILACFYVKLKYLFIPFYILLIILTKIFKVSVKNNKQKTVAIQV